jgi:gliding motility associated protien GldN
MIWGLYFFNPLLQISLLVFSNGFTKHGLNMYIYLQATRTLLCLLLLVGAAHAQPVDIETEATEPPDLTESAVLDDFTERQVITEKSVLRYAPTREADILWEQRLWRVIDTREKMNKPFVAPQSPLFSIISAAALSGELTVYSTENDQFTKPLTTADVHDQLFDSDTLTVFSEVDYSEQTTVVFNTVDWESVKRFRLKEVWWFDTRMGTLRHRILGIAPMIDVVDEDGNFRYERPVFWVHYPSARPLLARHKAMIYADNTAANTTWEDLFELRYFSSSIYKESNLQDRRLQDYLTGVDLLMEGRKIQDALFNREQDLWQQ